MKRGIGKRRRRRCWLRWHAVVPVAVVIVAGLGVGLLRGAPPSGMPSALRPAPSFEPESRAGCEQPDRAFNPVAISVEGVVDHAAVVPRPRDADDAPGTPPLTAAGKRVFAWDEPTAKPGSRRGNVLLNTHTYPDGSAMGNLLLDDLSVGATMVLHGPDGEAACYRVTDRVEVSADDTAILDRVFDRSGSPQVVVIVCSGQRRGARDWSNRTIWFGEPARVRPAAGTLLSDEIGDSLGSGSHEPAGAAWLTRR